jgi:hypothetical protein
MIASSTLDRGAWSQERVLQCMREFRRRLTVGAAHRAVSAANGRVSPEAQLIGRPALSAPD